MIPLWQLVGLGLTVGVLVGFWGMGGWIVTSSLIFLGIPPHIAVGTSLGQMAGQSAVAAYWHRKLGNINWKLVSIMLPGELVGVEGGKRLLEHLKSPPPGSPDLSAAALEAASNGRLESVVGVLYIILLGSLTIYMLYESLQAGKRQRQNRGTERENHDEIALDLSAWTSRLRLRPLVRCPGLRHEALSLWVFLPVGLGIGLLSGFLGVGGGFLRLPALVYALGCPTHMAVGTNMIEVIGSSSYGTFTHALAGNVDLLLAGGILLGSLVGAPLGSLATRYSAGTHMRALFAAALGVATLAWGLKTFLGLRQVAAALVIGVTVLLAFIVLSQLVRGLWAQRRQARSHTD
jgi:uncharacterized membrane protein YfcA